MTSTYIQIQCNIGGKVLNKYIEMMKLNTITQYKHLVNIPNIPHNDVSKGDLSSVGPK